MAFLSEFVYIYICDVILDFDLDVILFLLPYFASFAMIRIASISREASRQAVSFYCNLFVKLKILYCFYSTLIVFCLNSDLAQEENLLQEEVDLQVLFKNLMYLLCRLYSENFLLMRLLLFVKCI